MSHYLARLIQQTGVPGAGAQGSHAAIAPSPRSPAASPTEDAMDREAEMAPPQSAPWREAKTSAADLAASPEALASGSSTKQPSAREPGATTSPAPPPNSAPTPLENIGLNCGSSNLPASSPRAEAWNPPPAGVTPAPQPLSNLTANPSRAASEIIRKVMTWVAQDHSGSDPLTSAHSDAPSAQTASAVQRLEVTAVLPSRPAERENRSALPSPVPSPAPVSAGSVRSLSSPAASAQPRDPSWSVEIGAIHLTIEAPPEKAAPRPVEPRAVPPAPPARPPAAGSRLRRHYLRPF